MTYNAQRALELLRLGSGRPDARFREGQEEAIRHIVEGRGRLLVVQKTGWGKSFVYFIATKLLREAGSGPALLISPLLALMRNQIAAAERMGVRAVTINSDNQAVLEKTDDRPEQKTMANSTQQARNIDGSLAIGAQALRAGPVLLVDDMVDSRWTLTVAAWLLRSHGSGEVLPLALALAGHEK